MLAKRLFFLFIFFLSCLATVSRTLFEDKATQFVDFSVTPSNALVIVDDISYGLKRDGTLSLLLSCGKHSYRILAPGYISENGVVEVGVVREKLEIELKSSKGVVTLECSMPDAEIYVNNVFYAKGSWKGQLDPATYQVEVRCNGHTTRTTSFTLQSQETKNISLPVPQPIKAVIKVESSPSGAEVFFDGNKIGETPLQKTVLTGRHSLEFKKDGYKSESKKVDVIKGEENLFKTNLIK